MKYVSSWGLVYRLSDRNYRKLLRAIVAGRDTGTVLTALGAQVVCTISSDLTDMTPEDASLELESKT